MEKRKFVEVRGKKISYGAIIVAQVPWKKERGIA